MHLELISYEKWQYMSVFFSQAHMRGDGLNRYGEKGWELVCSHATSEGSSYYLKREIKYEKEKDES